ncbi:MAG TPA: DUF29 domain-containing protein [Rhodopila sp.]|nr:DUF29 domain-containing protein [Rhodopila sp.]
MADIAERTHSHLYETDEHAWIAQQIAALRAGDYAALDRENLIEFLISMVLRDERELESRLVVLLAHQFKMQHQPKRISRSWKLTNSEQQRAIRRLLKKLPSLAARADAVLAESIPDAIALAREETGVKFDPEISGLSFQQVMAFDPWAEGGA